MSTQETESNEDINNPTTSYDGMKDGKIKHKKTISAIDIWRVRRRFKNENNSTLQNTKSLLQETDNEDSQTYSYSFDHPSLETPSIDIANIYPSNLDSPTILTNSSWSLKSNTSDHLSLESPYPIEVSPQSLKVDGTQSTDSHLSLPHNRSCGSSPDPLHLVLSKKLSSLAESRRFSFELRPPKDSKSTSKVNFDRRCSYDASSNKSIATNNSEPCLKVASCKSSIDRLSSPYKSLTAAEFYQYFTTQVSESTNENNDLMKSPMKPRKSQRVKRSDSISSIKSLEEGLHEIFDPDNIRKSRESLRNYANAVGSTLNKSEEEIFQEEKTRNREVIKDLEEKYTNVTGEICAEDSQDPKSIKGLC